MSIQKPIENPLGPAAWRSPVPAPWSRWCPRSSGRWCPRGSWPRRNRSASPGVFFLGFLGHLLWWFNGNIKDYQRCLIFSRWKSSKIFCPPAFLDHCPVVKTRNFTCFSAIQDAGVVAVICGAQTSLLRVMEKCTCLFDLSRTIKHPTLEYDVTTMFGWNSPERQTKWP